MTALPTYAILAVAVVIFLMALLYLLRNSFTHDSYERQTASGSGVFSDQFRTIDDLPEKSERGQLMVKCPKCMESYSSGIIGTYSEIYQRHLERLGNVTTTCPFCKQQNRTSPRNMTYAVS